VGEVEGGDGGEEGEGEAGDEGWEVSDGSVFREESSMGIPSDVEAAIDGMGEERCRVRD
jgi:hypothetical protein